MKRLKVLAVILAFGALVCLPGMAGAVATVLTFDDVSTPNNSSSWGVLPTSYGGFTWSASGATGAQWEVIANINAGYGYKTYGNTFAFPSGTNAAYNGTPDPGYGAPTATVVSSATLFNFVGAYFSPWTNGNTSSTYGATQLTVTGKLGASTVGTQTINLTGGALVWTQLDFNSIDTLMFTPTANGSGYQLFVMDNFTVTPIPGAVWLLGSGLLGLVGIGRKRLLK